MVQWHVAHGQKVPRSALRRAYGNGAEPSREGLGDPSSPKGLRTVRSVLGHLRAVASRARGRPHALGPPECGSRTSRLLRRDAQAPSVWSPRETRRPPPRPQRAAATRVAGPDPVRSPTPHDTHNSRWTRRREKTGGQNGQLRAGGRMPRDRNVRHPGRGTASSAARPTEPPLNGLRASRRPLRIGPQAKGPPVRPGGREVVRRAAVRWGGVEQLRLQRPLSRDSARGLYTHIHFDVCSSAGVNV